MPSNYVDSKSLVPVIHKCDFDKKATEFLTKYYPQALEKPMAVPIREIAQKKIGLRVFMDYRLTEDFSILGQMCFTNGYVPIYDKEEDEFRDMKVRYGTMFVDQKDAGRDAQACEVQSPQGPEARRSGIRENQKKHA